MKVKKYFGKINLRFKEDIEPNEIVLDRLAKKKEEELGVSEKKLETPLFKKVLDGLFFFSLAVLFFLLLKTFQLQVVQGGDYSRLSKNNKFIFYQLHSERGVIYDRNFNQLVQNLASFDLIYDGKGSPDIINEVAKIIEKDLKNLKEGVVVENLDNQTLIILKTRIKDLPGFKIENNAVRQYKNGADFSQVIGYTGKINSEELKANQGVYSLFDYVGRAGLESWYEEILRKRPGQVKLERDALGNVISEETTNLPLPGDSLVLWLDSGLQEKIKESLEDILQRSGSSHVSAIALDPKTGGVLSMVSLPSFDNNAFSQNREKEIAKILSDKKQPLFNRIISGLFPAGSTIKPLIASAALEEKIISPQKNIYSPGFIEVPNRYDPEIIYKFLDQAAPGSYDMRSAIAFSSNVYFYTVGGGYGSQTGLGPSKIKKYLELFGWGNLTSIDLPGESSGLIPSPQWKKEAKGEGWWDGDTYNLSIGQGNILVTPLQVVSAFSAVANGGKLLQPQIVQKIVDSEKNTVEEFQLKVVRENFIFPENLRIAKEGMRQAVTMGSAVILSGLPVFAAAKTGTAQTNRENYYHNWVTVFAPYDDPQIVLTVLVEDVPGVQATALPVAKEALNWYFTNGNLK